MKNNIIKKYFTVRNITMIIVIIIWIFLAIKFYKHEVKQMTQYRKTQAEYLKNQRKNEELINATINDDASKVNELLKNIKIVSFNIEKPDNQDIKTKTGKQKMEKPANKNEVIQALLVLAVRNGSDKVFYSLHKQYPIKKNLASHLIIYAALLGNNDIINTLFKDGADLNAKITLEMEGQKFVLTPLLAAVESGNIETVKLLLKHGAKITDESLTQSARDERENITLLFLQQSENFNPKTKYDEGNYFTLLVQNGLTNITKKYINKFFNIDYSDPFYNTRPIQYAARYGDLELIKMLQKRGISLGNPNSKEWSDNFLKSAVVSNNKEVIDYALAQGFKLNWKDESNNTPVFEAAQYCSPQLFNYLLLRGADISVTNNEGETPAHRAIQGNNNEILKIIIKKLNIYNNKSLSEDLLAEAVNYNNMEAFKMFFDKGYKVNDKALKRIARRYKDGEYDDSIVPSLNHSEIRKMINEKYPNLLSDYEQKNSKTESVFEKMASFKKTIYNLPEQNELLVKYSPNLLINLNQIEKNISKSWRTDELNASQSGLINITTEMEKDGCIEFSTNTFDVYHLGNSNNLNTRKFYYSANRAVINCFGNIDNIVMTNVAHVNFIHALIYFEYNAKTKTKQVRIVKVQLSER